MPKWAKDEVQEATGGLPEGLATVKVVSMTEGDWEGRFIIDVETKVTSMNVNGKDQPQYKGVPFKFRFFIGTEADPTADKKETWLSSFAAKRYKSFLKAGRIAIVGNTEEECETAQGAELSIQISHREYTNKFGEKKNSIDPSAFYPIGGGSQPNGLDTTVKRVAAVPKRAAVTEYVEEE